MRTLLIAIGNVLRRDDGAAHRALQLLNGTRSVMQLTPEMAPEIALYDSIFFLDADVNGGEPRIEPVTADAGAGPLAHSHTPAQVVHLAEQLYGFRGTAYLCRIPGVDFGMGEGLSLTAEANAAAAARLVRRALTGRAKAARLACAAARDNAGHQRAIAAISSQPEEPL